MGNCKNCHSINNENAKYCRHCGSFMEIKPRINILELYPQKNLVPTNFYEWKKPRVGMLVKFILRIPAIICFVLCIYMFISHYIYSEDWYTYNRDTYSPKCYYYHISDPIMCMLCERESIYSINGGLYSSYDRLEDDYGNITFEPNGCEYENLDEGCYFTKKYYQETTFWISGMFGAISLSIFLLTYIICGYKKCSKNTKPLKFYADYVQKYSYWGIFRKKKTPKYVFFIKDNKFGILDVAHYKVYLSARYDYLEWREKKKYLNATLDGRNYIIDIYGNELK